MASSSTTWVQKSFKYDVFLSFRGEDTRTRFVSHLYEALTKSGITTYKDDKNLDKGKKIGKELIEAIEESRFHLIIFSKNYASSSWCLDELLKIMKCHKTQTGHTVYPIFYDVEPTEVRKQTGAFEEDFKKHENNVAVGKWREALKEVADLSGWELKKIANGHEADFIKEIVKNVSLKSPSISADSGLVGMRTRINDVISSLKAFPNEVCMIGILGMGGIGKTTLARAVFDLIRNEFEGSSFVANVREVSGPNRLGLNKLQQQMLRDVSNDQTIKVNNVLDGKVKIKEKLSCEKVLVVLDDVDHIDQLNALAGELNWFKKGSRIIVTTRNVLPSRKFKSTHDVELLPDEDAICLLSSRAFETKTPIPGYEELVRQVVRYASGLPLVLTTLGSLLFDVEEDVWIDTLEKLRKVPLDDIVQKLEISYASLDDDCKEIFLDIACMLKGWNKYKAITALKSRGFNAICGLRALKKKSLITISEDGDLDMHDHIQDMGRNIVRRNLEPKKHTRLWIENEVFNLFANNLGTNKTTCLTLHPSPGIKRVMNGLEKMKNLRFLYVTTNSNFIDDENWSDNENWSDIDNENWKFENWSIYLPNSLQYLRWDSYPFISLPKRFQASNLVTLEIYMSKIEELWENGETKVIDKLRFVCIYWSENLKTLNLLHAPNIEKLDLDGCDNLETLYMPGECRQLKSLHINNTKLESLDLGRTPNLKELHLFNCHDLVELNLSTLKIFKLHQTHNLEELNFGRCCELELLSIYIYWLENLKTLNLLHAPNIEKLNLGGCDNLVTLYMPGECRQLKSLHINNTKLESLDLGRTPNLKELHLYDCRDLVVLNLLECPSLISLKMISLSTLKIFKLHQTHNLEELDFDGCCELELFPIVDECPKLKFVNIVSSKLKTLDLRLAPNIKELKLKECHNLELCMNDQDSNIKFLSDSICKLKHLKSLKIHFFNHLMKLPEDLGQLQCLEELEIENCRILCDIPSSICKIKSLRYISLLCCPEVKRLPRGFEDLECLEKLNIYRTGINHLSGRILSMKQKLEIHGSEELMAYVIKCLPESKAKVKGNTAFINY